MLELLKLMFPFFFFILTIILFAGLYWITTLERKARRELNRQPLFQILGKAYFSLPSVWCFLTMWFLLLHMGLWLEKLRDKPIPLIILIITGVPIVPLAHKCYKTLRAFLDDPKNR